VWLVGAVWLMSSLQNSIRQPTTRNPVILSEAPHKSVTRFIDGRAVEGPRERVLCYAASRRSTDGLSSKPQFPSKFFSKAPAPDSSVQ